jgi:hypothetical protein
VLKRLTIVAVLVFGWGNGAWSQVPGDGGQQENAAKKQQDNAQPVQPPPVTLRTQNKAPEQKQDAEQKPAKYPWSELLAPANIPNWVLVIVAALTGGVICWQSKETRKAAQSAERQITLQSAAMRQWVNIEPIGTSTPPVFGAEIEVTLEFAVRNRTDYLVSIQKIVTEVFTSGKAVIFTVSCDVPLPPEKSGSVGGYPFFMTAKVNRETWATAGHPFFIGGDVTFIDCMKLEQTQSFFGFFVGYGDGRLIEKKTSGQVPEIADYKPPDQANPN